MDTENPNTTAAPIEWISVDAALNKSGVARWDGTRLVEVYTLRPMGSKGQWARWSHSVKIATESSRFMAWSSATSRCGRIIVATERGAMRGADRALGRAVGYLEAIADQYGVPLLDVELSTWRRAIADEMAERGSPITWPAGETKAVATAAARALYPQLGAGVTDDEAEAVLIGHAAKRLRLVEV